METPTPPTTKKRKRPPQSKYWVFTINNFTAADGKPIEEWIAAKKIKYIICGKEHLEDGTPHIQGFVAFTNRQRATQVAKVLPRAWSQIKSAKSTFEEAIEYCKKDGDFNEYGEPPKEYSTQKESMKKRWEEAYGHAKAGDFDQIEKCMLIRHYHAFKRIHQDNPPRPADLEKKQNYWILAPSQHGKSTFARKRWPDYYDKGPNKWFTGYKGQETLLLDDFGPKQCKYLGWYMKRWADHFSFPMETKGGGRQIRPKHIVVTSQYPIERCFEDDEEIAAIKNRFTVINLPHWRSRIDPYLI